MHVIIDSASKSSQHNPKQNSLTGLACSSFPWPNPIEKSAQRVKKIVLCSTHLPCVSTSKGILHLWSTPLSA